MLKIKNIYFVENSLKSFKMNYNDYNDLLSEKHKYTTIPNTSNYNNLREFIKVNTKKMSDTKVKRTGINYCIPAHLVDKYKKISVPKHGGIKSFELSFKDILTKLNEQKLPELINEFLKLDVDSNIYDNVQFFYTYVVDNIYLVDLYIKFIKNMNMKEIFPKFYKLLLDHVTTIFNNPIKFKDPKKMDRWITNNIILIASMYNNDMISFNIICDCMKYFRDDITWNIEHYIKLLRTIDIEKPDFDPMIDEMYDYLSELKCDTKTYENRIRIEIDQLLADKFP